MKLIIVLVLIVINFPIYKLMFNQFFESKDDFLECVRYSFTPDFISLLRREYLKDWGSEMRLQFYLGICGLFVFVEYLIISAMFVK